MNMNLSIDGGASTLDVVVGDAARVKKMYSFERDEWPLLTIFKEEGFRAFLKRLHFAPATFEKILVTGGKSAFLPRKILGIPVVKVSEIEAIGRGGYYLLEHEKKLRSLRSLSKILVVSMGTGTCMVKLVMKNGRYFKSAHVGGTGVGGGTLMGLSKSLLGEMDPVRLVKLLRRGNTRKVDLSVADIIGSGIGIVPGDATASHLARMVTAIDFSPMHELSVHKSSAHKSSMPKTLIPRAGSAHSNADLAAGIVNLVGQTIGVVSVFAAKAYQCEAILLTGKLTRMQQIVDTVLKVGQIYGISMAVPVNAAYVAALGAMTAGLTTTPEA